MIESSRRTNFRCAQWLLFLFSAASFLLCVSCAQLNKIDESNVDEKLQAFIDGKIELTSAINLLESWPTGTSPTATFRATLPEMYALYLARNWAALSKLVIKNGFSSDVTWFYLAVSAEGLGYSGAARHYYENSQNSAAHFRQYCVTFSEMAESIGCFDPRLPGVPDRSFRHRRRYF